MHQINTGKYLPEQLLQQFPEFFYSMKCQIVGIMKIMSPSEFIIISSTRQKDKIRTVKLPINILETMLFNIRVPEQYLEYIPVFQIPELLSTSVFRTLPASR